jgi:hypothetical protein
MHPSRTLRFPYIEASNARVNFKYGDEKQPFSFLDGDIAIWLENPSEWQLRFKAQPARTDVDLYVADTGTVRIEGSMQRAASLGSIPLNLRVDWERAPLGQVARLFSGDDPGWRGDLDVRSRIHGTPDELIWNANFNLSALHRVEFAPEHALDYSARCGGTYQKAHEQIGNLSCVLPIGNGSITATGSMMPHAPQLDIALEQVPASAALNFLKLMRENFGRRASIDGLIGGRFSVAESSNHFVTAGSATAEGLAISGAGLDRPMILGTAHITALPAIRSGRGGTSISPSALLLTPIKIDFGASSPLLLDGRFDRRGFLMHFGGSGSLARLVPVIHSLGLFAPGLQALQPIGQASLDVLLRGPWMLPLDDYGDDRPSLQRAPSRCRMPAWRLRIYPHRC